MKVGAETVMLGVSKEFTDHRGLEIEPVLLFEVVVETVSMDQAGVDLQAT